MRISDWSSDVCSSDLGLARRLAAAIGIQRRDRIVLAVGAAFATIEDVVGGKVDERRAGGRAGLGEEAGAVAVHRHGPRFLTLGTVDGSVGGAVDDGRVTRAQRPAQRRARSAARRVGKEWGSSGRSRWAPYT